MMTGPFWWIKHWGLPFRPSATHFDWRVSDQTKNLDCGPQETACSRHRPLSTQPRTLRNQKEPSPSVSQARNQRRRFVDVACRIRSLLAHVRNRRSYLVSTRACPRSAGLAASCANTDALSCKHRCGLGFGGTRLTLEA